MLITLNGRVELDPMQVPRAASMATGRDESFAQVLQQAIARDDEPAAHAARPEPEDEAPPENAVPTAPASEPDAEVGALLVEDAAQYAASDPTPSHTAVGPADVTENIRRGEPVRQETAGKGADSPRTSAPRTGEPLLAAVVQQKAAAPNAPLAASGARGVAAVGSASATSAPTRGIDAAAARPNAPLPAPAIQAPYRADTAASAQLLEHARDSVFKQILMQLRDDGGEMRLRLQPPELGELDLRLVVESGNRLSLQIAADRSDIAQLLQRHLDELKHTLQQSGLEVTGAHVQTRSEFAREQRERDGRSADGDARPTTMPCEPTLATPHRGFISATGLDFWA